MIQVDWGAGWLSGQVVILTPATSSATVSLARLLPSHVLARNERPMSLARKDVRRQRRYARECPLIQRPHPLIQLLGAASPKPSASNINIAL